MNRYIFYTGTYSKYLKSLSCIESAVNVVSAVKNGISDFYNLEIIIRKSYCWYFTSSIPIVLKTNKDNFVKVTKI